MNDVPTVDEKEIADALRLLGLAEGDIVVVHSSLRAFGYVEGGSDTVVSACLDVVGTGGTLIMPTFTTYRAGGPLDPWKLDVWTGGVGLAMARRTDCTRDCHPLYSFACRGPLTEELKRMNEAFIFHWGRGKSLWKAAEAGGWVLLLGIDHRNNSSVHLIEELGDVDYLQTRKSNCKMTLDEFIALDDEGKSEALGIHNTGPKRDFALIEPHLEQAGVQRITQVGNAEVRLVRTMDLIEVGTDIMKREPLFLVTEA